MNIATYWKLVFTAGWREECEPPSDNADAEVCVSVCGHICPHIDKKRSSIIARFLGTPHLGVLFQSQG